MFDSFHRWLRYGAPLIALSLLATCLVAFRQGIKTTTATIEYAQKKTSGVTTSHG